MGNNFYHTILASNGSIIPQGGAMQCEVLVNIFQQCNIGLWKADNIIGSLDISKSQHKNTNL